MSFFNDSQHFHLAFLGASSHFHRIVQALQASVLITKFIHYSEIAAKKHNGIIIQKELINKSNDVPKGTEDKVYSAVVFPITKNVA
jgi:hypothetical protein